MHSEREKKTRQMEEEVGKQHQGMDSSGVRQVPEGSGEQGKMKKTGCKIICGASTTLVVKGLMMMNLFWQLSRDRNLHSLSMSYDTTAFPKPPFKAPGSVGDVVVGRGNAG